MPKRDWLKDLRIQEKKDGAKIIKINEININEIKKILHTMRVKGICYCGNTFEKGVLSAINNCHCKNCNVVIAVKKRKITKKNKYGNENYNNSQKNKETVSKRTPEQQERIRNSISMRMKKAWKDNGDEIKKKQKDTNIKRFGNNYKEIQIQKQIKTASKRTPEQQERINEKRENTNTERYGSPYVAQLQEFHDKMISNRYVRKIYSFKTKESIHCQGDEIYALKILEDKFNYTYNDYNDDQFKNLIFKYMLNNKHKVYFPDIPFLRNNKIIEVKSVWTHQLDIKKNIKKAECVINKGYAFEWWIFDNKKELTIIDTDFIKNKFIINQDIMNK